MGFKETLTTLENIISLFKIYPEGLTTKEIYRLLHEEYSYTQTLRNLEKSYIERLINKEIEGVTFVFNKGDKHTLIDKRIGNKEAIQRHYDKLESQQVLMHEEQAYMRLALEAIKKLSNISTKHHKIIEKRLRIDDLETPYFIEKNKIEHIESKDEDFIQLKDAIAHDNLISFRYLGNASKASYVVEPYKFLIFDGLWYLYGKDTDELDESPYKTWRYKYIHEVEIERGEAFRHQVPDDVIEKYLSIMHSPYFNWESEIKVKIKIDPYILKSFNPKVHLPGYRDNLDEDDLTFSSIVSNYDDIAPEIKSWLPYIEIIEPDEYKIKLRKELEVYIDRFL